MTDRWMNVGYEDGEELRPYVEPLPDFNDPGRLGMLLVCAFRPMLVTSEV